MIVRMV